MKEWPDLDEVIEEIQKMIDASQRSYVRYIHVGTLMDILHLLKEREPKPVKITQNEYDNKFYHCPNCDHDFYDFYQKPNFCERCGQAVKWDE